MLESAISSSEATGCGGGAGRGGAGGDGSTGGYGTRCGTWPPPPAAAWAAAAAWVAAAAAGQMISPKAGRPSGGAGSCSRRRDCHFTDTPSSSLLKHLIQGEGRGSRMTVSPTARPQRAPPPPPTAAQLLLRMVPLAVAAALATASHLPAAAAANPEVTPAIAPMLPRLRRGIALLHAARRFSSRSPGHERGGAHQHSDHDTDGVGVGGRPRVGRRRSSRAVSSTASRLGPTSR